LVFRSKEIAMNSLASELKGVLQRRIEDASPAAIAQIVGALAGNGANDAFVKPLGSDRVSVEGPRFLKLDAGGRVLDRDDEPHAAVYDVLNDLSWSRSNVTTKPVDHPGAVAACRDLRLCGKSDWRLPTIRELLTLVDYERYDPAIDGGFFDCESAYYWTSTPVASNPADAAWIVFFHSGYAYWVYHSYVYHARAVRSGQ
jgi:hypothetical protein